VFEAAWKALKPERANQVRLVIIHNTLQLEELWVSENLLGELGGETEAVGRPFPLTFMTDGQMNL
jgi:hypothetical protein